ncbi:uncharacterized protein LOC130743430 [Lotus japonicus]|uniref:Transmembrane protein n=1 Tax=Lotus japonicus TaxID=34305 RepID=I3T361_LOTJA|nr:uncharacterized protein LOC130743430 [Lotus japonicus]AFK46953.1 unknown [Lotus japonicus]
MATTPSPQIATFLSSTFHHSKSHPCISLATTSLPSLPSLSPITIPSKKSIIFQNPRPRNTTTLRPITPAATAEDTALSLESAAVDAADLVTTTDDGVSVFISALFFVAFIGLSVITFGVVYLGVKDFLQKKETEKFEKEAAAKGGKKKKKKVVRARAGPKGFGQKIDKDEDDD